MSNDQKSSLDGRLVPLSDLLISVTGLVLGYCLWRYPWMLQSVGPAAVIAMRLVAVFLVLWGIRQPVLRLVLGSDRKLFHTLSRHRVLLPRQGLVYLVMMLIMALGSLLGHSNMLMLVFAMMAGPFVLNGWVVFSMLKRTSVKRRIPKRAMVGQVIGVEIELSNRKRWLSSRLMLVEDQVSNGRESLVGRVLFVRVPPRDSRSGRYQLKLMQRGRYRLGPATLSSTFPLGLGQRGMMIPDQDEILVYPRIGYLHPRWKQRREDAALLVQRNRSRRGTYEDEFHRIREYREGDNPRGIHWRTSARRNELMVKEYHQNREFDMAILMDLWQPRRPNEDDQERVELAVSFAATLALDHMRDCRDSEFSLVLPGKDQSLLRLRPGQSAVDEVLDCLAVIQAQTAPDLDSVMARWMGERSPYLRSILISTRPAGELEELLKPASAEHAVRDAARELEIVRADWSELESCFAVQ